MEKERIKRDLRRLRKITHGIEVSMRVKETHEKRLAYLNALSPSTNEAKAEAEKIRQNLSALRIEDSIKEATALETLYMGAISRLDPLDRTIILDGYINGKAYWKIGRDIGYTERGVQNRIGAIIERLSKML